MVEVDTTDSWEDVTAHGAIPQGRHESGTYRVSEHSGPNAEIDAPSMLGRDTLCSIIADYVSRTGGRSASLDVRETLDRLGLHGSGVPQPLAGHFVLSLANRLACPVQRSGFLAHAWNLLGHPPLGAREPRLVSSQ